jgi:hypothetical protein
MATTAQTKNVLSAASLSLRAIGLWGSLRWPWSVGVCSNRLTSDEAKVVSDNVGCGGLEASGAQSTRQVVGSHGIEGVPDVAGVDHLEVERLLANEDPAWSQDPVKLGE